MDCHHIAGAENYFTPVLMPTTALRHLRQEMQYMTFSEVPVKCPAILICPPGNGIEVDWLMRGQVSRWFACRLKCLVVVLVGQEESCYGLTDP